MQHHRIVRYNVECILNRAANSEPRVTVTGSVRFMFILCIAYGDLSKNVTILRVGFASVIRCKKKNTMLIASWTPSYMFCFELCDMFKLRVAKLVGRSTLMCKTSKNVQLNEVQHIA